MNGNKDELFAAALAHHQAGRLGDAERLYRQILAIEARHADALHLLGVLAHQVGRDDAAVDLIAKAIAINGRMPAFHGNLGVALRAQGKLEAAVAAFERALALESDYAEAHNNRGVALQSLGREAAAVAAFERALALKPDYADAHNNLGISLKNLGKPARAVSSFGRTLVLKPDHGVAHNNLGNALRDRGRPAEAMASYRRALVLAPDYAEALGNLANVCKELRALGPAESGYKRALAVKPDFPDGHYNLGVLYLLSGRFTEGWPEYEWRIDVPSITRERRDFGSPRWRGEDLKGRTILLHAEQGLGDVIQFCRYVPLVAARGGSVLLEVPRPLTRLLGGLAGVGQMVARGDRLPPFDLHCPLMSLPRVFGTRLETIPAPIPYLAAEAERVGVWRDHLGPSGFRIGIAWQGSPDYTGDRQRSIPLACFAPLGRIPGVRLISLQKAHGLDQLERLPEGMAVETLGADFDADPFLDTAAVLMSLDLVVTVDTAVGHLAGALGRPLWLPLASVPHWIWMLERDDSPWYPQTRLFRQRSPGDWPELFERMADALRGLVRDG